MPELAIASEYQRGQRFAQRLLEDRLAAQALDHQRRRDLPLAEAGQFELAAERAGALLDAALHLVGLDLDLQAHARVARAR